MAASKKAKSKSSEPDGQWTEGGGGYSFALSGTAVLCRNDKGVVLKTVPKALKDDDVFIRLRQLADFLEQHEAECRSTIETWMLRSLPIPATVAKAVWDDPAWRNSLRDLVIEARGVDGSTVTGLYRDHALERGLGIVTLDGETEWIQATDFDVPHPVRFSELDEYRGFAVDLGIEQAVPQLFRETYAKPTSSAGDSINDFFGGRFEQVAHVVGRARGRGFNVRGGFATCRVWENGTQLEAQYWIGADEVEGETETGDLSWSDRLGRTVPVAEVGPVAFSEGMRMAASIFAGRKVAEEVPA